MSFYFYLSDMLDSVNSILNKKKKSNTILNLGYPNHDVLNKSLKVNVLMCSSNSRMLIPVST